MKKRTCRGWSIAIGVVVLLVVGMSEPPCAHAQQRIGYVDSEYIMEQMPAYANVQQELDRLAQRWQAEIEAQEAAVEELAQEYQARELLYTDEERQQRREEITQARRELEQLRQQYFGPEGQLYTEQNQLMRPIQERVLVAVETVAEAEDYDYVFDKGSALLFMYAQEGFDLSNRVLEELGIDVDGSGGEGN